uniref:Uncharacterized protein n=1 Tax=Caenorhabditis tropicalis TaxID=1561998 RepID=A0A1I7UTC0_9PELO
MRASANMRRKCEEHAKKRQMRNVGLLKHDFGGDGTAQVADRASSNDTLIYRSKSPRGKPKIDKLPQGILDFVNGRRSTCRRLISERQGASGSSKGTIVYRRRPPPERETDKPPDGISDFVTGKRYFSIKLNLINAFQKGHFRVDDSSVSCEQQGAHQQGTKDE